MSTCNSYASRALKTGISVQPTTNFGVNLCDATIVSGCGAFGLAVVGSHIDEGDKIVELVAMHLDVQAQDSTDSCVDKYRGGWWADQWRVGGNSVSHGSLLWKLRTAKPNSDTLRTAIYYAQESMNRLAKYIGSVITVTGELVSKQLIVLTVTVSGPRSVISVDYTGTFSGEWIWGVRK